MKRLLILVDVVAVIALAFAVSVLIGFFASGLFNTADWPDMVGGSVAFSFMALVSVGLILVFAVRTNKP